MIISLKKKIISKLKDLNYKIKYFFKIQRIPDIFDHINIETTSLCNLKCKFCAYDKRDFDIYPKSTMKIDMFNNIVNQSLNLGYRKIGLTPSTGDIFMDKNILEKLSLLDEKQNYEGYFFYTNFIPINHSQIEKILLKSKKLIKFGISIYGHDNVTFQKFCGGSENAYKRLIDNLNFLLKLCEKNPNIKYKFEIGQRTEKNFLLEENDSQLSSIIKQFKNKYKVFYTANSFYDNWGGLVNERDVRDLNIDLHTNEIKKYGSCSLIYSRMTIGANGLVNACACRDANFTLRLGKVENEKLKDIISLKNEKYKDLIERQEKNDFDDVCRSCSFYKSIYKNNYPTWILRNQKKNYLNLNETLKILQKR